MRKLINFNKKEVEEAIKTITLPGKSENLIDSGVFVGNNKWKAVYRPLESIFPEYLCNIFHEYPNLIKSP